MIVGAVLLALCATTGARSAPPDGSAQQAPGKEVEPEYTMTVIAVLVTDKAAGWGMIEPRATSRYKIGDNLKLYIEPRDYRFGHSGGVNTFGMSVDLGLIHDGKVIFAKDNFFNADFRNEKPMAKTHFSANLDLGALPRGDYIVSLIVRDHSSTQVARTRVPFSIE
jgi:hypothetical protein